MHLRISVNDYVMSVSTGQRELLFIEYTKREHYCVLEQPRRRQDVKPGDPKYLMVHRSVKRIPCKSLFDQAKKVFTSKFESEIFVCEGRTITRVQFGPQVSVKWAAYKVDNAIYFAPYTVGNQCVSDIYIRDVYRARPKRVTFESTARAIQALVEAKDTAVEAEHKTTKRAKRKASKQEVS